ncbi:MAG: hypothetical protein R2760_09740 [Chitinophagales bacterium]
MQIVIYTFEVTNRLNYVLDFIFVQYFGLDYYLETDIVIFKKKTSITNFLCINYSNEYFNDCINIYSENLLFEKDIHTQKIFISKIETLPILFPSDKLDISFPFDIFAAIFYLISRYEEYLPHEQDEHGRYCSHNSILAKPEFSFKPIVEIWLAYFKSILLNIQPGLEFKRHKFTKIFTFDIDNAFQYKHRNWFKHPPNIFITEVRNVLFGKQNDKYNTFDELFQFCNQLSHKPYFFFLLNDSSRRNSNVSPKANALHHIIKNCTEFYIGIHSSYHFSQTFFIREIQLLSKIVNYPIVFSRQHFLKISFPDYFRTLVEYGITKDFSLSYPNISGCRAGTTQAFFFFDIINDKQTSLLIQPFIFMDATYQYYIHDDNYTIQHKVEKLLDEIQRINGNFVSLFHNDLLHDSLPFKNIMKNIQEY